MWYYHLVILKWEIKEHLHRNIKLLYGKNKYVFLHWGFSNDNVFLLIMNFRKNTNKEREVNSTF